MGGNSSKPEYEPTLTKKPDANEMLEQPWRHVTWKTGERQKLMSEIAAYYPSLNSVPLFRVVLVGPVGAGKSSFFNSVKSVIRGHVTTQATAAVTNRFSWTTKYRTYQITNKEDGKNLPIIFCDTMGLEDGERGGLHIDDVPNIIKGDVPDKYLVSWAYSANIKSNIKCSSLKDEIHCFVFVIEAPKIEILSGILLEKLKSISLKTNVFELPQLVIITKVDEVCPSLEKDVSDVYRSKVVQRQMQMISEKIGIPLCNIVPVKNYCSEVEVKENVDILILLALRQILRLADSYLDNFSSDKIATVD